MVQLADSIDLSTNIEFLDLVVQILDGGVFYVASKDEFRLLLPTVGRLSVLQQLTLMGNI